MTALLFVRLIVRLGMIELMKFAKTIELIKFTKNFSIQMKQISIFMIHIFQRNLEILTTEIYKVRNHLGPEVIRDIFHFVPKLNRQRNRTVHFETEGISSLPPQKKYGN